MLKIKDLHVSYGGIKALRGIDLEVPEGKIVTLIGANGAGKSTMLRTISGLVKADSGSITYNDKELLGLPINKVLEEGIAHAPLVYEVWSWSDELPDIGLVNDAVIAFCIVGIFLAQSDVEDLQFADIWLVVGEHHCEFLVLQGQGNVGSDYVCPDVVGVVLAHQSRRDVDADNLGRRLVNILHKRCEAA